MLGISTVELERRFDGTPGSLVLDFEATRGRYARLREQERAGVSMGRLLDSAKLLIAAGQPKLTETLLRLVAERIRGAGRISAETSQGPVYLMLWQRPSVALIDLRRAYAAADRQPRAR